MTPCPHPCTAVACTAGPGQCHERCAGDAWIYDPAACERERAALDEHSQLSWELEQAEGRLSGRQGPGEPIGEECDGADRPG